MWERESEISNKHFYFIDCYDCFSNQPTKIAICVNWFYFIFVTHANSISLPRILIRSFFVHGQIWHIQYFIKSSMCDWKSFAPFQWNTFPPFGTYFHFTILLCIGNLFFAYRVHNGNFLFPDTVAYTHPHIHTLIKSSNKWKYSMDINNVSDRLVLNVILNVELSISCIFHLIVGMLDIFVCCVCCFFFSFFFYIVIALNSCFTMFFFSRSYTVRCLFVHVYANVISVLLGMSIYLLMEFTEIHLICHKYLVEECV